jgi:hypothetical protein
MDLIAPRGVHCGGIFSWSIVERGQHLGDELAPLLGGKREDLSE